MNGPARCWHVITPEFPPVIGGVADYSRSVAAELAAQGEQVRVWHPGAEPLAEGYSSAGLRALSAALDASPAPRRLFVQWVPHGYGYKAMNVGFCRWLLERADRGDHIDLMVHEPFLMFGEGSWKQDAVAAVHRLMIALALRAASRLWVAIPAWETRVRPWLFKRPAPCEWLPIPSNIPVAAEAPRDLSAQFANGNPVAGHFGTYGRLIMANLRSMVPSILERTNANLLLLGKESDRAAAEFQHPRVRGNGTESAVDLSRSIAACDVFVQPFQDGVSARRSSVMAVIAHGKPLLTTSGPPTEPLWASSGGVVLEAYEQMPKLIGHLETLLSDRAAREGYGLKARQLYERSFALPPSIRRLRESPMVTR